MEAELQAASEEIKARKEEEGRVATGKKSVTLTPDCTAFNNHHFYRKPIFTPGRKEPGTPRHTPRRIGL